MSLYTFVVTGVFPLRSEPASAEPGSSEPDGWSKLLAELSVVAAANGATASTGYPATSTIVLLFSRSSRRRRWQQPNGLLPTHRWAQPAAPGTGTASCARPFFFARVCVAGRSARLCVAQRPTAATTVAAATQPAQHGSLSQRTQSWLSRSGRFEWLAVHQACAVAVWC